MYCHSKGIAHGAIDPGNIFVDNCGKIKLFDFEKAVKGNETNMLSFKNDVKQLVSIIRTILFNDKKYDKSLLSFRDHTLNSWIGLLNTYTYQNSRSCLLCLLNEIDMTMKRLATYRMLLEAGDFVKNQCIGNIGVILKSAASLLFFSLLR